LGAWHGGVLAPLQPEVPYGHDVEIDMPEELTEIRLGTA
jgi:hypothetical protein